jgi:transcriptional regulator with XRE-family HTH domain/Zn-dependent peptidase ImmA (M78 family)
VIKNERQYKTSVSQRARLHADLSALDGSQADEWIVVATRDALQAQIADIAAEIADYDSLRSHPIDFTVSELSDLPNELVRARIARNLSQQDLAERLGLKQQQVQRYEATDYAGASIGRLDDVMRALNVHLSGELVLAGKQREREKLRDALRSVGLSAATIKQRFFASESSSDGWMNALSRTVRVFGASAEDVLSGDLKPSLSTAAFRAHGSANRATLSGYAAYAEYLAELAVKMCQTDYRPLPPIDEIRATFGERLMSEPFTALLELCWDHGIPVVPLSDRGSFYGACWFFDGRPAIVLKNAIRTPERWAFLLAHEMDHSRNPDETSVLESDLAVKEWRDLPAEQAADTFAEELLLDGKAEALAVLITNRAGHSAPALKSTVIEVAEAVGISAGMLADFVAYRVSTDAVNWWPTAVAMHTADVDAWQVARSVLFAHVDLSRLDSLDRDIFIDGMAP